MSEMSMSHSTQFKITVNPNFADIFALLANNKFLPAHFLLMKGSEIKRQQERGCKHRGNWIMPVVGGNELSSFSISSTICFYLVINGSSVWWQQAAGLSARCSVRQPRTQTVRLSARAMFPLHTHADEIRHANATHAHAAARWILKLWHAPHMPTLFHFHIIRHITSVILVI